MKTVHEIPLEKNKCVVALEIGEQFIPVIGINQTPNGYFINYYINKVHLFLALAHMIVGMKR